MLGEIKGFRKLQSHLENTSQKCYQYTAFKSPTSFRQISASKDKKTTTFATLKSKRLEHSETSSKNKHPNLFSKIIESRNNANQKIKLMDQSRLITTTSPLKTINNSIITENNKQNNYPKGLQFKGFPHKKLVKTRSDGPSPLKSSATPKKQRLNDGPVIGSNKKNKGLNSGPQTDRYIKYTNIDQSSKVLYGWKSREDKKNDQFSMENSVTNSVVKQRDSLLFDMSPTLI